MGSRIDGSNSMRPIVDQAPLEGKELTPEGQQMAEGFKDATSKATDILNQTVRKGDMDAARARVDELKKHFESLSPEMKKEMYSQLTQKGVKGGIQDVFDYKLSTPSRERLLKILNEDHVSPKQFSQADVAKTKASKTGEKNLEGKLQQASLREAFDAQFGGNKIESQRSPGAIKMPTFGPSEGPGAVKMPTFGPGDGPGAIKMPEPKSGEPGIPFSPGPVKMSTFGPGDGPGATKMPQPKADEPRIPFTPEAVKMPTFGPDGDGPGAVKMPTFGPGDGPGAIKMPQPKSDDSTPFSPDAVKMPTFGPGDGPGATKMPQPNSGKDIGSQSGVGDEAIRKFIKGDAE